MNGLFFSDHGFIKRCSYIQHISPRLLCSETLREGSYMSGSGVVLLDFACVENKTRKWSMGLRLLRSLSAVTRFYTMSEWCYLPAKLYKK